MKVTQLHPELLDHVLDPHTRRVMQALHKYHIPFRVVGGAVRNLLLGQVPRDIDMVADADPSEIIYVLSQMQMPMDVGGIEHGTVKAVFGEGDQKQKVDISSLGYRILEHNSRIRINRAHNWREDAQLRDLTINAMSMDLQGNVYDYVGGYEDLHEGIVKFVPQADKSLTLDATGIMRYFRALVFFDNPVIDDQDLQLIRDHLPDLASEATSKKVTMNLITILNSDRAPQVLKLMCMLGVHQYLPSVPCENNAA